MPNPLNQNSSGVRVALDELIAMRQRACRLERLARRVTGSHAAVHVSRFRGRGVDYAESRAYQPGDDIRQMDWRVTARTGRPHTKMFEEERERSVLLVLDCNLGMRFGTRVRFKSVQAARTAALIAWATVLGGDRIGAIGYGPGLNAEVKPGGGARSALRCMRAFVEWDSITAGFTADVSRTHGATMHDANIAVPLSQALQRAQRLARPGTQIVILTDGFDTDAKAESALSLLADHCDVAVVLLTDVIEQQPPPPARYALQTSSGSTLLDFAVHRTRQRWPLAFAEQREALLGILRRRALTCVRLATQDEPEIVLRSLFGLDARRARAS